MVLVRRLIGDVLRRRRVEQGRTLREVSAAARVSLGYLSEVERGRKEASSELLAAICLALDLPMSEVLREVSDEMSGSKPPPWARYSAADRDRGSSTPSGSAEQRPAVRTAGAAPAGSHGTLR